MKSPLQNHPFAVEATFDYSLVLTYAVPESVLQDLIPPQLSLDTYDGNAFIAVAMVNTKDLRPKSWPRILGRDFFLIGYRIFVRYRTSEGRNLRGLYILRSETNRSSMRFFGSLFTHYNYNTIDVEAQSTENGIKVRSEKSALNVEIKKQTDDSCPLPASSIFPDWKAARKFAGPLPFTFTSSEQGAGMLLIEGVRQNWKPQPVTVIKSDIGFLNQSKFGDPKLVGAFVVENVDYSWKKGRIDPCP